MNGAILSCFVAIIAVFLITQANPVRRWNFNEDTNEIDFINAEKRTYLERRKRLCGITTRRQDRCQMGVGIDTFLYYCLNLKVYRIVT